MWRLTDAISDFLTLTRGTNQGMRENIWGRTRSWRTRHARGGVGFGMAVLGNRINISLAMTAAALLKRLLLFADLEGC